MTATEDDRIATLERETEALSDRLARLERRMAAPESPQAEFFGPPRPASPRPKPAPRRASPRPAPIAAPATPRPRLEDLLGGRVLAWTGGLAVVLGIVFLLAVAVSRGWIGEGARTAMAGLGSIGLLAVGIWLRERRGRIDAALAAAAAGIAGMFATVAVGGPAYGVLPVAAALAVALATGGCATSLAVRWAAPGIGALGICGALLAPVLAGAPSTATTMSLLWIAAASGAGVLVWQRWNWLAAGVFVLALPQWLGWLFGHDLTLAGALLTLAAFGLLNMGAAIGFELRVASARLRLSSALLLTANALVLAAAGWFALDEAGSTVVAHGWLAALAAAHLAIGVCTARTRVNRDVRLLALALGVVLADVTLGVILDGPVLAGAWGVGTAAFAVLARTLLGTAVARHGRDEALLGIGLGGHLLLTVAQALLQAPPDAIWTGESITPGAHAAVATAAMAAFVAGRFTEEVSREWRIALDAVALGGAAYLSALALDGATLVVALAAEAAALGALGRRERDPVAASGGLAFLAAAAAHALAFEAPPPALVTGLDDAVAAAAALGAVAGAALHGAWLSRAGAQFRTALIGAAAVVSLYLASTAVVTAFAPGDGRAAVDLLDLGARQLGQALLSAMWAAVGVGALVAGLRRDVRALRLGALGLLCVTIGKVFLFDLATLTSVYRVASFIALGLLLLFAAFAWERARPRPLPDLRAR